MGCSMAQRCDAMSKVTKTLCPSCPPATYMFLLLLMLLMMMLPMMVLLLLMLLLLMHGDVADDVVALYVMHKSNTDCQRVILNSQLLLIQS